MCDEIDFSIKQQTPVGQRIVHTNYRNYENDYITFRLFMNRIISAARYAHFEFRIQCSRDEMKQLFRSNCLINYETAIFHFMYLNDAACQIYYQ